MKIVTFNVNSLRMRLDAVLAWLRTHSPDVLALQETKLNDAAFPHAAFTEAGWHSVHHGQGGYNGVALITKAPVADVRRGLNDGVNDPQSRLIEAKVGGVRVVNTYIPQGSEVGSDKFAYKLEWLDRLLAYFHKHHSPTSELAWVGDFNVAPEDIDCYAPDFFANEVGLNVEERARLEALRAWGFTDVFRALHPGKPKQFTFFDYRTRDSAKYRKGWRIDHIWVTPPLAQRLVRCDIDMAPRMEEKASDHTPLWAEFS